MNEEGMTAGEMRDRLIEKATEDADFRARLLSDPKGTIGQELGVTIPASLSIEVHEESGTTVHLVLPPDSKLSEGELQTVAGGTHVSSDGKRVVQHNMPVWGALTEEMAL